MSSSRRVADSVRRACDPRHWSLRATGALSVGVLGGLLLVPATGGAAAAEAVTAGAALSEAATSGAASGAASGATRAAVASGAATAGATGVGAATTGVAEAGVATTGHLTAAPGIADRSAAVARTVPAANSTKRPLLERGSQGHWVELVQRQLDIAVDGIFGPVTESAVRDFQREQGLLVDGIVGPQTWGALDGNSSSGSGNDSGDSSTGASAAVSYARGQVGDGYTYGGDGPNAFDCSGLTMRAWEQAGVKLPHSSQGQSGEGTSVGWSGLRAGDLVFFYDPISHVGIYVGGGEMVAASNPEDGVEVVNIRSSYWRDNFATARRM